MMKIDVSYDALLEALVEAIRDERDHGAATMSLVSRLVEQACQQDWFEAHWKTDARLKLAQMACGHMPKGWRAALPVLEVIAEAARWALKADEVDPESRAILLAITRLADAERSARRVAAPKPRPVAQHARRRRAKGAGAVRGGRRAAQPAQPAKRAASPQAMTAAKTRPAAVKTASVRKTRRAQPAARSHAPAQPAKPAASSQAMTAAKVRSAAVKTSAARKTKRAQPAARSHAPAQPAKPAASPQAMTAAKARPTAATTAPVRKPNGASQASPEPGVPVSAP